MAEKKCAFCNERAYARDFIEDRGLYLHAECVEYFQDEEEEAEHLRHEVSDLDIILKVACPLCAAPVRTFCVDPKGKRTTVHKVRRQLHRSLED